MGLEHCRVSISGIRGVVGHGFDVELVLRLSATLAVQQAPGPIVLARDTRSTGPVLRHAVLAGILSRGVDVLDLGIVPTPTVGFTTARHTVTAAINITASHNPPEWNALKLFNASGLFFSQAELDALLEACATEGFAPHADWETMGHAHEPEAPLDAHLMAVAALVDRTVVSRRKLRVAIDGCRGAGSIAGTQLLRQIGCEVIPVDCEPDGRFTRGLEPIPEHLSRLSEVVRNVSCDVGFALDPDADRLALVDETGLPIGEEYTLALAAEHVLSHRERFRTEHPVAVTNLSSSRLLDDVAARHGARVIRTPVGEANVVQGILSEKAVIGGEGNGGVILPAVHPGRDALTGMALIVQMLCERGTTLRTLVRALPRYVMLKTKLAAGEVYLPAVFAGLRDMYPDATVDDRDGLLLSFPDRWIHVRASNTEPIVRVIAEAPSEEIANRLVDQVRRLIDGM